MKKQFWVTVLILVTTIIYLRFYTTIDAVPLPADIEGFPKQVGTFTMTGVTDLSETVLRELKVSSYLNRDYRDRDGNQLSLYLGYYEEQREGAMIHSPRHCMPGSGWNRRSQVRRPAWVKSICRATSCAARSAWWSSTCATPKRPC